MRTWFITGVSRGLGLAIANAALTEGDTVIGTVREKGAAWSALLRAPQVACRHA